MEQYAGARRHCSLRTRGSERGPERPNKTSVGKPDGNWEGPDVTDVFACCGPFFFQARKDEGRWGGGGGRGVDWWVGGLDLHLK